MGDKVNQAEVPPSGVEYGGQTAFAMAAEAARFGIHIFGIKGSLAGTPPQKYGDTKWLIQAGTQNISSGSKITFPNSFPTCLLGFVWSHNMNGWGWISGASLSDVTLNGTSSNFQVSWIAIGC